MLACAGGCGAGQGEGGASPPSASSGTIAEPAADGVAVSRSLRFGQVNAAPYGSFAENGQIKAFDKAIRSATKIEGILDVAQPDYDVVVTEDGKRKEIHLWLDARSKRGMYAYVSDTGTGYTLTEASTRQVYDLIWGLKYGPDQAEANGDLVNAFGLARNRDQWETFIANVEAGVQDELQIVRYTFEGDPVFDNLSFDGTTIMHRYDSTHDAFGSPGKTVDFCRSIEGKKKDDGTEYVLSSCGEGSAEAGRFSLYLDQR
ncbi:MULTISPECIES: DUF4362 domain-containing protein [unclassified Paenibacillus]|uniref:DUF4362 domain-containing protein n=1 Tax=unclassified Paenibacillus TaxID=185978 RepID=UPI000953E320|nr:MULTISPECIES: DUF4362 domain-containing protein [unclassified Paenibacillus]ASS68405.1 DUF4362 domain-containing protein [Paenibacillus sp. RUD330]SIR32172.1 protein of unknown function [Paenibacillus sp. RU4X]SIR43479.1 protein of unknown function [Paenibacillus sp. RU4T]